MKYFIILSILISTLSASAQQKQTASTTKPKTQPLPAKVYNALSDSCNGMDITFFTGVGGSMSLDNRNVRFFTSFVSTSPVEKKANLQQDGLVMWEINGKEFLTGNLYFSGDSSGYLVFNKNDKEYINSLTKQGAGFLMTHGKKKK